MLDQAVEQITLGIASLRQLINDLRPPILDEAGVQPALEHLVHRLGGVSDLEVEMNVDLAFECGRRTHRLSASLEDALYRVVQEALNNVIKHSGASRVVVSVIEGDETIDVRVADNGAGMGEQRGTAGFGLIGMQERVELMGGTLEIRSPTTGGTEVRVSVPVIADAANH